MTADAARQLGVLAAVSARLNADVESDEALRGAVVAMREGLGARRVTLWVHEANAATYAVLADPPLAAPAPRFDSLDALAPPAPDAVRAPLRHAGDLVGVLEADGAGLDDGPLLSLLAGLLAPFVAAVELSENLAFEVAKRSREVESQRLFTSLIIDSLPVGLYAIDREFRIQVWNRKRESGAQGALSRDVVGRDVFEVLSRQPRAELQAEFEHVFATGELSLQEVEVQVEGTPRWYRISKIPMRLEGTKVTHVITIGEDITEWKSFQGQIMQSEKLAAIGQLAAGVMHEINNPLATIGACVAAVEGRLGSYPERAAAPLLEYLEMIDAEVQRCTQIVGGLLDFSRPKGKQKGAVALNGLVHHTLKLIRHHERFREFTVTSELDETLAPALGNEEQLVQVLLALLLNAIDSMPHGGRLALRTYRHAQHGDEVVLEVEDTGHGIPRTQQSKIFEPFYTTKPPGRGTGLGLSICYGIIEAHRGRIEVDSMSGRGATFRVVLPVAAA